MSRLRRLLVRARAAAQARYSARCSPDVELDFSAYPVPGSPILRGKAAALDWSRGYWGTWHDYVLEPTEIIDAVQGRVVAN